jgi:hypothetical protein
MANMFINCTLAVGTFCFHNKLVNLILFYICVCQNHVSDCTSSAAHSRKHVSVPVNSPFTTLQLALGLHFFYLECPKTSLFHFTMKTHNTDKTLPNGVYKSLSCTTCPLMPQFHISHFTFQLKLAS